MQSDRAHGALRILANRGRHHAPEVTGSTLSTIQASEILSKAADDLMLDAVARVDRADVNTETDSLAVGRLRKLLERDGLAALSTLARDGTTRALDAHSRFVLEAIIKLTSRPGLRVINDTIDLADRDIGDMLKPLAAIEPQLPQVLQSVGRIDLNGHHVGTGFLIAEDLVMTNRHVLEELATPAPTILTLTDWELEPGDITIDFKREADSPATRVFRITNVEFAGPNPISSRGYIDFADLDVAILRIEKRGADGGAQPAPLPLLRGAVGSKPLQDVLVVGYPARPNMRIVDQQGSVRQDVIDALRRVHSIQFSVKYLSPGVLTALPGAIIQDPRKWVFSHDATTLGGNSGSCVLQYGPQLAVIGIHFAGTFDRANYAHALQVVEPLLPSHVRDGIRWVE